MFTDLPGADTKLFIKLTFQQNTSVERLSSTDLILNNCPVLVLEPAQKQDLEKSLMNALPHHQIVVRGGEDEETVREVMSRFGSLADIRVEPDYFVVTFTQKQSAQDALREDSFTDGNLELSFSQPNN